VDPLTGLTVRSFAVAVTLFAIFIFKGDFRQLAAVDRGSLLLMCAEGLLAGLLGQWLYFKALKGWGASSVVPVVSSYSFFAFLFAVILLGEKITVFKSLGVVFIILGLIFLGI
jgi:uncharacterized membrane protein